MPYFLNEDNLEIFYQVLNPLNRTFPVIFLHGYGNSWAMFEEQILFLKNHFKLILFDAIGHGNSDKPNIDFQENLLLSTISDLKQLLKLLKIDIPFGIIGHSLFGCAIAQEYVMQNPKRIKFLVLLNGGPLILDSTIKNIFWNLIPQFTRMHFNELPELYLQQLIQRTIPYIIKALKPDNWDPNQMEIEILKQKIHGEINNLLNDQLAPIDIESPTLIISSELDNYAPLYMAKSLHADIPISELKIVTMAGHFGLSHRSEIYNQYILDFLKKFNFISSKINLH